MSDKLKHGKFTEHATQAERRKHEALERGHTAPIPHDLTRRLLPLILEHDRRGNDAVVLYVYLLGFVNGDRENDRYMAAFPSVDRIAIETGIGRNRVAKMADILEAVGMIETTYDYTSNKRDKLYYPQYYSGFGDDEIRARLRRL